MRALGYTRQSIAKANEHADDSLSLEAQEDAIRRYCIDRGYRLVDVIRDHDITGKSWTRPGIQQMLAVADRGEVDVVVVYKLSRFARDVLYQELVHRELGARNVRLESVTEAGIDRTLIRIVHGAVNQHHNEELSQWTSDTIRQRAMRGLQNGEPPFGYRTVRDGRLTRHEIVPEHADIIRRIFAMRATGVGCRVIATALNNDGIVAQGGGPWRTSTVQTVLANARYAGYAVYKREIVGDADPEHMPAIIDRAVWEATKRITARGRTSRTKHVPSWVEGLVDHGCGKKMYLYMRVSGKDKRYFMCPQRDEVALVRCPVRPRFITPESLETAVRMCLLADLKGPIRTVAEVEQAYADAAHKPKAIQRRDALVKRRDEVRKQMKRAEDLVLSGLRDKVWLEEKNQEQYGELNAIAQELDELSAIPNAQVITVAARTLQALESDLDYVDDSALRRILAAVGRAEFGPNGITIRYHPDYQHFIASPCVVSVRFDRRTRAYVYEAGTP